jgi:hypothetical protein
MVNDMNTVGTERRTYALTVEVMDMDRDLLAILPDMINQRLAQTPIRLVEMVEVDD